MIYVIIGVITLILDIITKNWAVGALAGISGIPIINGVFHLTYVENTGVAFGMMQDKRVIFVTLSIFVLLILGLYFYRTQYKDKWLKLGTALVFSGSIGNMIERVFKGYVVDFLDFRIINFPVFNVADVAVCVGAVCLIIHFLFFSDKNNTKTSIDKEE